MNSFPVVRFPQAVRVRVPEGMPAAIQAAARKHHTSPPEWVRQLLLRGLEAEGLSLRADGQLEDATRR